MGARAQRARRGRDVRGGFVVRGGGGRGECGGRVWCGGGRGARGQGRTEWIFSPPLLLPSPCLPLLCRGQDFLDGCAKRKDRHWPALEIGETVVVVYPEMAID